VELGVPRVPRSFLLTVFSLSSSATFFVFLFFDFSPQAPGKTNNWPPPSQVSFFFLPVCHLSPFPLFSISTVGKTVCGHAWIVHVATLAIFSEQPPFTSRVFERSTRSRYQGLLPRISLRVELPHFPSPDSMLYSRGLFHFDFSSWQFRLRRNARLCADSRFTPSFRFVSFLCIPPFQLPACLFRPHS